MCIHCDAIGPICMDIASRDFEGMCMLSPSERAAYFAETRREDLPLVTDHPFFSENGEIFQASVEAAAARRERAQKRKCTFITGMTPPPRPKPVLARPGMP